MKKFNYILLMAAVLFATACKEEEGDDEPTPSAAEPTSPQPYTGDADGALIAVNTATTQDVPFFGTTTIYLGTGVAVFGDLSNGGSNGTWMSAGDVSLNGSSLDKQSNNSYTYLPSATDMEGIDFDNGEKWTVSGEGSISGFTDFENPNSMPVIADINGAESETSTSEDLTVAINTANPDTKINSADSIIYAVYGTENQILVTKHRSQTSHTFTADQMSTVGAGFGYIQVAAYNMTTASPSGQKIAFVNEAVITKPTTFK